MSRRQFLGAAAAVGGGLVVGFHVPFAGEATAQDAGTAEINAWVVVKPDDTVVIRIARSEMGQGTLTGLAQLVAEELDCDWAKVQTEYPTPGAESRAQPRLGQLLDRRQPRHPRVARLRAQGRRGGARDAGAGGGRRLEGSRLRVRRFEERHHAHAVGPHDELRQGRGCGRQAHAAGRTCRSRIRRTGRSPASASHASTPRTRRPARRSTAWTSRCPAC